MPNPPSSARTFNIPSFLFAPVLLVTYVFHVAYFLIEAFVIPSVKLAHKYLRNESTVKISNKIYGLEHGRLNLEIPAGSMWMNMGYWKVCGSFATYSIIHLFRSHALLNCID
jgi:hypothetical protein